MMLQGCQVMLSDAKAQRYRWTQQCSLCILSAYPYEHSVCGEEKLSAEGIRRTSFAHFLPKSVPSFARRKRMPRALTAVLMGIATASALSPGDARPTVVVAGATGKAGSAVVRSLVESGGVDIVALVRSAAKARTLYGEDSGVEIAEADYADSDALDAVLREHPACRIFIACANGPNQARLEMNLCEAAKRHGASHAVKLSTATPVLEMKAGGPYGAHLESEAALAASGLPCTMLTRTPPWPP